VLVTSNSHAWRGVAAPVEIRLWPKEIGANYLIARTGREAERPAAETLSEALGGLPLAHEQAAAYCERLDIALAEYGRRFAATPARLLDDERHAPTEYHDGLTVAKTFALAIDEAAKLHPAAEPLIVHAALLAPEPIPLFLFAEAREKFGQPLATALAGDGLDEVVAALRAFALIDREGIADERYPTIKTDTIRLHRLVREVAAGRVEREIRLDALGALLAAVTFAYPDQEIDNPRPFPRARRLNAIALALIDETTTASNRAKGLVAELLHRLALYAHGALADYGHAISLEERALAIRQKMLGDEHPDTAVSLNHLGLLIERQGHFTEARPFYERAMAINEKVFGPEDINTGVNTANLGRLLVFQGDLIGARSFQERAVAIFEKTPAASRAARLPSTQLSIAAAPTRTTISATWRRSKNACARNGWVADAYKPDPPKSRADSRLAPSADTGMSCKNLGGIGICGPPRGTAHYRNDKGENRTRTGLVSICD
jgi:tetratricopeptide (TPR) repeat protein